MKPKYVIYKIYLWRNVVCHIQISQTMVPFIAVLVPLESCQGGGMHQIDFVMLQTIVRKLLNIKHFASKKSFKSKQKNLGKFGHALGNVRNPFVSRI